MSAQMVDLEVINEAFRKACDEFAIGVAAIIAGDIEGFRAAKNRHDQLAATHAALCERYRAGALLH